MERRGVDEALGRAQAAAAALQRTARAGPAAAAALAARAVQQAADAAAAATKLQGGAIEQALERLRHTSEDEVGQGSRGGRSRSVGGGMRLGRGISTEKTTSHACPVARKPNVCTLAHTCAMQPASRSASPHSPMHSAEEAGTASGRRLAPPASASM